MARKRARRGDGGRATRTSSFSVFLDAMEKIPRRGVRVGQLPSLDLDGMRREQRRADRGEIDATLRRVVAFLDQRHRDAPHEVTRAVISATSTWLRSNDAPAESMATYARALIAPVLAILDDTAALIDTLRGLPAPPDGADETKTCHVGDLFLFREAVDSVTAANPRGAAALLALDDVYPLAINTWSAALDVFRGSQSELRAPLERLGFSANEAAMWLRQFVSVPVNSPCVVLVPELDEAYGMSVTGVLDLVQFNVLLADVLHGPLKRLGAPERPSAAALQIANGQSELCRGASIFRASFHLFAWQAVDPTTMQPVRARFAWSAVTGWGDGSLPVDFLVGDATPLDGTLVFILVGPNHPAGHIGPAPVTRTFNVTRTFPLLRADLTEVRRLPSAVAARWRATVQAACARLTAADLHQDVDDEDDARASSTLDVREVVGSELDPTNRAVRDILAREHGGDGSRSRALEIRRRRRGGGQPEAADPELVVLMSSV